MIHLALQLASFLLIALVGIVALALAAGIIIVIIQSPERIREWSRNRKKILASKL
jgi:hypothetical protein